MADVTIKSGSLNGGVLGELSKEWFSRPADERITGANSWEARLNIAKLAKDQYNNSSAGVVNTKQIEMVNHQGALALRSNKSGAIAHPSYFAFGQICARAGAPAGYIRALHDNPDLAAANLNHGLKTRDDERIGVLLRKHNLGLRLDAATGPTYGRVWNWQVLDAVNQHLDPNWTVPGIFGKAVGAITKENTSLFLGSQDMFIGLSDEHNKIEIPNRRDGKPGLLSRGVLIGNSESGAGTLKIWAFLFDYACFNRNFWGVEDFTEISIRHTSGAPARFMYEAQPAIRKFLNAKTAHTVEVLKLAQHTKVADPFAFLTKKFTKPAANAIITIHKEEEHRPIETLWDCNVGATAYARTLPWQDERLTIERLAGEMMPKIKDVA